MNNMGLDVSLRLQRPTGEYVELANGDFRGSAFDFVKDAIQTRDACGKFIPVEGGLEQELIDKGMEKLAEYGFAGFDSEYGIMGFLKIVFLREFYAQFGYILHVEADW